MTLIGNSRFESAWDWAGPKPSLVLTREEALGELWMGGTPSFHNEKDPTWDTIVGLEHEVDSGIQKVVPLAGLYIWHPINDGSIVDAMAIRQIAQLVADRVEYGDKVLVHCSAGLNRSGVVSARALMYMGFDVNEAVSLLRERRDPYALCNSQYVKWLFEEQVVIDSEYQPELKEA